MGKPKTPSQKAAYKRLNKRLSRYVAAVEAIYDNLNAEAAKAALRAGYTAEMAADGKAFRWEDYPQTKASIENLQAQYVSDMGALINRGTSVEWKTSNELQDLLATKAMSYYDAQISGIEQRVYYQKNNDALKAFQERKDKGMNLSEKLWEQSDDYRTGLEAAISTAIEKGTSAITLSKQISKYLQDFPLLKADYTEMFGHANNIHDCEYRSARLARSEINMAYRKAEQLRWSQMDFIVGYEIKTSAQHPAGDICNDLAGKYPKDFVWTGWHPNCMCYKIPIMKTDEEFWAYDGRGEADETSVNAVTEMPENFVKWVGENADRISEARQRGTLPYFIKDNEKNFIPTPAGLGLKSQIYKQLQSDPNFNNVNFNSDTGGLMATHIGHNFDKKGGLYEKQVQRVGFTKGHSVILGDEPQGKFGQRSCDGFWDGHNVEIAGAESGRPQNIRNALKHCAKKRETEYAVIYLAKHAKREDIERGISMYNGLKKSNGFQWKEFDKIIFISQDLILNL